MAPLLQELPSLEVESLEVIVNMPELEPDWSLYTYPSTLDEIVTLSADTPSSVNGCCCCCCPICCFWVILLDKKPTA